jgi:hypothetical protein
MARLLTTRMHDCLDTASGVIRGIHAPHPKGGKTVQIGYPTDLSCLLLISLRQRMSAYGREDASV